MPKVIVDGERDQASHSSYYLIAAQMVHVAFPLQSLLCLWLVREEGASKYYLPELEPEPENGVLIS